MTWGVRKNPGGWPHHPISSMHWLQRSSLKAHPPGASSRRCTRSTAKRRPPAAPSRPSKVCWAGFLGPVAAAWSHSSLWPTRSRSAWTASCGACSTAAATPSREHEWLATADQSCCPRLPHRRQFHRHRLFTQGHTQTPADQSASRRCAARFCVTRHAA